MTLETQVCNLELAQKLKKLGVEQESLCYWFTQSMAVPVVPLYGDDAERIFKNWGGKQPPGSNGGLWSAFTVAELGEMLPHVLKTGETLYYITHPNGSGLNYLDYVTYENGVGTLLAAYPLIGADTEADARAKMLIYLLENKLLKIVR